jgi:DivIVA domain-containing protein
MIDLTPLDVRNKRGDFKKLMRGYDPQEVDVFLEIVAERLEALTRENMALKERTSALQAQVNSQTDREQAVQAALVTAQELRADIRAQAQREADNVVKAAETEGRRLVAEAEAEARTKLRDAERQFDKLEDAIETLDRRRVRFLKEYRQLLQREMDVVVVEEARQPMEDRTIDLDLGARRRDEPKTAPTTELEPPAPAKAVPPAAAPPPPTQATRHDNFLLYLDADADDANR